MFFGNAEYLLVAHMGVAMLPRSLKCTWLTETKKPGWEITQNSKPPTLLFQTISCLQGENVELSFQDEHSTCTATHPISWWEKEATYRNVIFQVQKCSIIFQCSLLFISAVYSVSE